MDKDGNSAFHLAAKLDAYKPWLIPNEALQMHAIRGRWRWRVRKESHEVERERGKESERWMMRTGGPYKADRMRACIRVGSLFPHGKFR